MMRVLRRKSVLAVNLVLVTLVIWGFSGEFTRNRALQQQIDALDVKAAGMRKDNLDLTQLREKFAGTGELEREARMKLNLQKPGEEVVVIQGETAGTTSRGEPSADGAPDAQQADGATPRGNVARWWNYFFNNTNH